MREARGATDANVVRALVQSAVDRAGSHSALARAIGYRRETVARWLDAGQVSDRGQVALRAYLAAVRQDNGGAVELQNALTHAYHHDGATWTQALAGMLCDLRHIADGYHEHWDDVVRQANTYYADELAEPPDP